MNQQGQLNVDGCYQIEFSQRNVNGTPIPAGTSSYITMSRTGLMGAFYQNDNCYGTPTNSIQIQQGSNWIRFGFRPTSSAANGSITATIAGGINQSITNLIIAGPFFIVSALPPVDHFECHPFTVTAKTPYGGDYYSASPIQFAITANPSQHLINKYSDENCQNSIAGSVSIPANQPSRTIYLKFSNLTMSSQNVDLDILDGGGNPFILLVLIIFQLQ